MTMVFAGFDPVAVAGDFLRRAGGELTADEVGDAVFDDDCFMTIGSTRAMGGLTDCVGEM